MEREVALQEVLEARDMRARRQERLLEQYGRTLISFCMNIAGPVKNGPLIRRMFRVGMERLTDGLRSLDFGILHSEELDRPTGCEALLVTDGPGAEVKALCVELEDREPAGRLFDLDVLTQDHRWDREALNLPQRKCLVCGRAGKDCASRRLHSVPELQQATYRIMAQFFAHRDRETVAGAATRALLYEVCTTPKPGLVDRANSGSHRDMDIFTFLDSVSALTPYFRHAFAIGQRTAASAPNETFLPLRRAGLEAEREMFRATGGVNTHKGAIFSLGIVCAAAGRLWQPERPWATVETVLAEAGRVSAEAVSEDFQRMENTEAATAGQRLYRSAGLRGIRGEVADGLPSVGDIGLPVLREALASGATLEEAGITALLHLMANVSDTNLIARGGMEGQRWAAKAAADLTAAPPSRERLEALDREMITQNLSPGGCADLLSITYFLHFYSAF